jgi:adenosylcobinamide-GDP ribazoletransferase
LSLGIMTMLITALSIGQLRVGIIFQGIIVIELCAKLSMVVAAWAGKSVREGMNSPFLEAMHGIGGNWRLVGALMISFAVALLLLRWAGAFIILAALVTAFVMVAVAHKHFNGVTGDVFGATNELTRMVCAIVLLAVAAWA